MIILMDNGTKHHHICPACKLDYLSDGQAVNNETIPIFYSDRHAYDEGWRCSTDRRFSKNGEPVWVCPDCWPDDEELTHEDNGTLLK